MPTTKVQEGETITVTSGGAVAVGDVDVIGEQIGVALNAASGSGESVAYAMDGVWNLPKVSGAVIAAGESVIWDVSAGAFDDNAATPASGDVSNACTAWEAAGNGVTTIAVKLNTGKGSVT